MTAVGDTTPVPTSPQRRRPRLPGVATARVTGRSMRPTLQPGDLLLVSGRRPTRPGSLVLVRLPEGRPVGVKRATHRVDGGWWVERDSPVDGVDSWTFGAVPDLDVLGVVLARLWPRPRRLPPAPPRPA